jgi:hypothetical protein
MLYNHIQLIKKLFFYALTIRFRKPTCAQLILTADHFMQYKI